MAGLISDHQGGGDNCPSSSSEGAKCGIKMDGKTKIKASSIAQKAAKEAKDASDAQMEAGEAAARQVKQQLADKALAAAKAPWPLAVPDPQAWP